LKIRYVLLFKNIFVVLSDNNDFKTVLSDKKFTILKIRNSGFTKKPFNKVIVKNNEVNA